MEQQVNISARRLNPSSVVIASVITGLLALLGLLDIATSLTYAAPLPQDTDAILRIINSSDQVICLVFISATTDSDWGDNWLGDDTIPPNEDYSFNLMTGDYNVLLVDCGGNVLLGEQEITVSGLYELRFREDPARALFDQATAKLKIEACDDAISLFQQLLDQYPDSKWTDDAQTGLVMSYYVNGDYEQAIAELDKMLAEHPDSEYVALAQLFGGLSYYHLGDWEQAKTALQTLIDDYPDSKYVDQARQTIQRINSGEKPAPAPETEDAATALLDQAITKLKAETYADAIPLLQQLLDQYPDSEWADDAQVSIGICHYKMGNLEQAKIALQALIDNYLDSEYVDDARQIIRIIDSSESSMPPLEASEGCISLDQEGMILYRWAHYPEALQKLKEALACYREAGDRRGVGDNLNNIGYIYSSLGRYQEALDYYQQALTTQQDIDDRRGVGQSFNNIGTVYSYLGQYQEALAYCQQALTIAQEIDDRRLVGDSLHNIGAIYENLGQYPEALDYYQQTLTIAQENGDRAGEGTTLDNIGGIYGSLGQYPEALDYHQQALTIQREIGDRAGEGTTLNNIGGVYIRLGQYPEALEYCQQALIIAQEIGDRAGEGVRLHNIGGIYSRLGQYQEALDYYQQALSIRREIGGRAGLGETLSDIGVVYAHTGRYQEALGYHQQALTIAQEISDRAGESRNLSNIGGIYSRLGQYKEALDYLQQALAIRQEIGNRAGEGTTLNNIGSIYGSLGQYPEALDYLQQALTIAQEIGDRAGESASLNNIGDIYARLAQYQEALDYYQQALTILKEIGDRAGEGRNLNNIGGMHARLGRYQEALGYHQQALTIAQEIGDRAGEGTTLNNIGAVYDSLGQYQEALEYYHQALTVAREIGEPAVGSAILNNIGFIYSSLRQYQEAFDYHLQALAIRQEIGDLAGVGGSFNNVGSVYAFLGQYQEALDYHQQALTITQEIGDRAGEGVTLGAIGFIYHHLGKYQEALDYYHQALIIAQEIGDRAEEGAVINNTGDVYYRLGQYQKSLDYLQQALAIRQEIGDRVEEGVTLYNIGTIFERLGQYEEALGYYREAIAVTEMIRSEMTVEEVRSSFAAGQRHVYGQIIPLLTRMERPDEAFGYVQRAKARTFLDQLGNVRIAPRVTDNADLLAREQELLGQIRALEAILAGRSAIASLDVTTRDSSSPPTDEQRIEIQSRLQAAYREYEQLLTQIKLTNPQYASLRTVQASTLITVQQTLAPDVTLLEYYVAPTETLAFVVTQDDFHAVPISVSAQALNDSIVWFRQFSSLEGVPQASQELYDLLFAPAREHIHNSAIYIAPHFVLHYLPFGALHDGEHYLVEDYTIGYIPSASLLQYVNVETQGNEDAEAALVLGNPTREDVTPLPFAEQESQAVADLFGVPAHIGEEATESVVWEAAPQARYVHLAAHGSFNPVAPQFSRLYLAPDEAHDGYLELHEVWNLRLDRADLVTLSACETQLGELSAGDEVVGLSRAFIYAGTPSLVASLWSVNDESTCFLMERFYGYLKEGTGKASALRQAQLDTMDEYPSPYHWAPFTLIGELGEVATGKTVPPSLATLMTSPWLWISGGIVLIALVGVGLWTRNRRK
jgi:tetratricopeptide (TPR) repeat protein